MAVIPSVLKYKRLEFPKTSIIATIGGPDIYSKTYITNLAESGMSIARVNLAHLEQHRKRSSYRHIQTVIKDLETISMERRQPIGILFDVCGPKIRVAKFPKGRPPIPIQKGTRITFTTEPKHYTCRKCSVTYHGFVNDIDDNDRVFLDDGKIELRVLERRQGCEMDCEVVSTSVEAIESAKGFNLPDTSVKETTLTKVDQRVLEMLGELDIAKSVDFLAFSFVRKPQDVPSAAEFAKQHIYYEGAGKQWRYPVWISKIETYEAVKKTPAGDYKVLNEIIAYPNGMMVARSDLAVETSGIMVARGDLAVETSPEDVPLIQRYLTRKGIELGKPVIIATQMLLSMTEEGHKRPTRAEANDVATAVFNYADCIMLSEETARGANPALCVRTMRNIALQAETSQGDERSFLEKLGALGGVRRLQAGNLQVGGGIPKQQAIAESAILFAENLDSPAIVVSTSSGDTAIKISKYRPTQPIIAITHDPKSANRMLLYRGIYPFLMEKEPTSFDDILQGAKEILQTITVNHRKFIQPRNGEKTLVPLTLGVEPSAPLAAATPGNTNTIYILEFP